MKSRSSGYSSDSEQNLQQQDLSVLRKPIYTALNGFMEAKRAFENGTEEIRRLLSRECDIIYECNICRNMFRSLTNFISHKRVYCRNSFNNLSHNLNPNRNGYIDHDVSTIIQVEENIINKSTKNNSCSNNNSNIHNNSKDKDNSNKDLSSIVEKLLRKEQENRTLKLTDYYDQVNKKLLNDDLLRKKHVLQLDKVPNSNAAVYQTVKNNDNDNIQMEVNEIHQLLKNNDNEILGPDGKIIQEQQQQQSQQQHQQQMQQVQQQQQNDSNNVANTNGSSSGNNSNNNGNSSSNKNNSQDLSCEICHKKFSTEKMLKLHIQAKHITSTYVYQCPSCSSRTFLQPGALIRHLSTDHGKSARRIRLMRDSINKRRIKISDIQPKGPNRELARLQLKMDKKNETRNSSSTNNGNDGNQVLRLDDNNEWSIINSSICTFCGKTFERKAVLTTHLANCQMKMKNSMNAIGTRKSNDTRISHSNRSEQQINTKSSSNNNSGSSSSNGNTSKVFDKELFLHSLIDKKSITTGHPILDSIDLTKDDSPSTSSNVSVSKRKRKKTLKFLKEDCTDIESEKLNEMFLKLDCSDDNKMTAKIQKRHESSDDNIKIDNTLNDCSTSLVKKNKTKENELKNSETQKLLSITNDQIKIEELNDEIIEAQMGECIVFKRRSSSNWNVNSVNKRNQNVKSEKSNDNKISELEQQLTKKITIPIKTILNNDDNQKEQKDELDKSNDASLSPLNQYPENQEQSNQLNISSDQQQQQQKQNISFLCKICEKKFDAISNVRRHISMFHYRSRKFGCRICGDFKAFRKCDVINHLSSAHSLTGDKEVTMGFVEVHCNKNKNDCIEDDIVVVDNSKSFNISVENSSTTPPPPLPSEQVKKRIKKQKLSKIDSKDTQQQQQSSHQSIQHDKHEQQEQKEQREKLQPPIKLKFTRSSSNLSLCSSDDSKSPSSLNVTSKRPIRNRVKPVHKDFVYDLSHILKKDALSEILPASRTQKRRNTLATNCDFNDQEELTNKVNGTVPSPPSSLLPPSSLPPSQQKQQQQQQQQKQQQDLDNEQKPIKGSAQKMAKIAVASFRASFCQMSDNFPERAALPLRILSHMIKKDLIQNDCDSSTTKDSHKDKSMDYLKCHRLSTDDNINHIILKRKRLDPFSTNKKSSIPSIIESINLNGKEKQSNSNKKEDGKIMVKCPTEKEFKEYLIANKLTEPVKKIPVTPYSDSKILGSSTSTPSSPLTSKRITLMQRLTENKHKKLQQSLLRSVLEN